MEKFDIHILGCGAALPTPRRLSSAQIVNIREKLFMLDCAEGTQMALRRSHFGFANLNAIFLTHLHGDHCFGLIGLISTLGLLGRKTSLNIYGPQGLVQAFQPQVNFFCQDSPYSIALHEIDSKHSAIVYEDRSVEISTIPLAHRVPCCGYLLREKPSLPHIRRDLIDYYHIPVCHINNIKAGMDYTLPDGRTLTSSQLTYPADPPRSYAYCTDTMFRPQNAELLRGVTALYHEATFANSHAQLAKQTFHSTASQAAEMAKLSDAQQLIIGHFSARYKDDTVLLNEAQAIFPNTILANDGMCVSL